MNAKYRKIEPGCFWYPFRPWLRWPLRALGVIGVVAWLVKIVVFQRWSALMGFIIPLWLLLSSFETPEPRLKTGAYYAGAALVWLAALLILLVIVLIAVR